MRKEINENQELSNDLCEFIGALIGDGYTNRGVIVGICGHNELDKSYFKYLNRNAKSLFGLDGSLIKKKNKNANDMRFYSKNLYDMLTNRFEFPKKRKTENIKIPGEIMNSDESLIFSTIRGIFDTDGCIFFDRRRAYSKPYPRITLQIVSVPLINQLVKILGKYFVVSNRNYPGRNAYYLEIYGHEQFEKWMNLIGFSNERHLNRIEKALGEI
ncbi:MAG: LAGLIDADG family homing endonuclease [Candidatus Diapherotrites archaeon]